MKWMSKATEKIALVSQAKEIVKKQESF